MQLLPTEVKIGVENPGYSRFRNLLNEGGTTTIPLELDEKVYPLIKLMQHNQMQLLLHHHTNFRLVLSCLFREELIY